MWYSDYVANHCGHTRLAGNEYFRISCVGPWTIKRQAASASPLARNFPNEIIGQYMYVKVLQWLFHLDAAPKFQGS